MLSDESDESDKEEYDELGSESGSAGTFGTRLGGLLRGGGFPLGVTLHDDESCGGDGGLLALSYKNMGESGTGGGVCTKCNDDINIFSIAQILSESWIYPMFVKFSGMG